MSRHFIAILPFFFDVWSLVQRAEDMANNFIAYHDSSFLLAMEMKNHRNLRILKLEKLVNKLHA